MNTHLHAHSEHMRHVHAHHRQRVAYSPDALTQAHRSSVQRVEPTAGKYTVKDSHLAGAESPAKEDLTSLATNDSIEHRQKMSELYTTMYAQQLLKTGKLEAGMVWVHPTHNGERTVAEILAANSALPAELR